MKKLSSAAVALTAIGLLAAPAGAAGIIDAHAVISAVPDGANFDYTITLTNTSGAGNDPIGTFWFAWVPGEDFLATSPLSVTNPSGWKDAITHVPNVATNGYAIQWEALSSASALAPGDSLTFKFTGADTPADVAGMSVFYPTTPVLTSFVYSGLPFVSDPEQFLVTAAAVPEPSTLALGLAAIAGSLVWRRARRRANG